MSEEHRDEPFLRTVAAAQAQMSLINAEADELTDLGDMQAQRKLKAELNEYVAAHSDSGIIPSNPLEVIGDRLKDISKLFSDAKLLLHELSETTKIVPYHELKSISLDGLKVELEQVKEMETTLPARNENLKQQLNPLDWSESSPAHLYPELLVCASALGVELPEDKEERREIYEFLNCKGSAFEKGEEKLKAKEKDIHELIGTHELYPKTLAVIMECTKRGDHIKASELLDTIKIPFADIPITECTFEVDKLKETSKNIISFCVTAPYKCDRLKPFVDTEWEAKAEFSDLQKQLGVYENILKSFPNSEIQKECKPLLEKARSDVEKAEVEIANRIGKRKRKRKFKLIAISVVLVIIGLVIADQYNAYQLKEAERARLAAIEEAERARLAAIEEAERARLAAIEKFIPALEQNNIEVVKHGLAAGANVNAKDEDERTPLHNAAYHGHKEIVELLIAHGADVNAKGDGIGTPLHYAALEGHNEVAELLIANGADVNAKGDEVGTPLHYAAFNRRKGRKEVAELLIANGADVNAKMNNGRTPLDFAVINNITETADILRKHGAKTSAELKASQN